MPRSTMATAHGRCRGEIFPRLGAGVYDVVATGVNTSGVVAFDPTVNELSVDTTSPTVVITSPASPTSRR